MEKLNGSALIRNIRFSKSGQYLIVNSLDRIIRYFSLSYKKRLGMKLEHQFMDAVDRKQWASCTFSADEEYVIGG